MYKQRNLCQEFGQFLRASSEIPPIRTDHHTNEPLGAPVLNRELQETVGQALRLAFDRYFVFTL